MNSFSGVIITNLVVLLCTLQLCRNSHAIPQGPPQTVTSLPPLFAARPGLPPPIPQPQFPQPGSFVPIVQQSFDINPDGSYSFGYQSADGSNRQEVGGVKFSNIPGVEPIISVQGSYSYPSSDGQQIDVQYTADENGYQPSGPGIHPAILKAVAFQVAEARGQQQQPAVNIPSGGGSPLPPPGFAPFPIPFSTPGPQLRTTKR